MKIIFLILIDKMNYKNLIVIVEDVYNIDYL